MKKVVGAVKNFLYNTAESARMSAESARISEEIKEGIINQSALMNQRLNELVEGIKNQTDVINSKLNKQIDILTLQNCVAATGGHTGSSMNGGMQSLTTQDDSFEKQMQRHPLMFARKTFNTSHPLYNPAEARNFPGKIFNVNSHVDNGVYNELKKMIRGDEISEDQWSCILRETLEEVKKVPHAEQVFERKLFMEKYVEELETKYGAYYRPGWVNLDDALFLYWAVRQLKPKVIVQTGVCNGLSSAFMMLALAKNGPEGTLHVINIPYIFDSNNDAWKIPGQVYGVIIPEGQTSGWLVPDAYRERFEVLSGDAKLLLPGLLKKLGSIDMFYHDSDHTYDHMMFELEEAKKYLTKSGVIVSDDISWNASLWDFADQYHVPAYNYRGSMGIVCF